MTDLWRGGGGVGGRRLLHSKNKSPSHPCTKYVGGKLLGKSGVEMMLLSSAAGGVGVGAGARTGEDVVRRREKKTHRVLLSSVRTA